MIAQTAGGLGIVALLLAVSGLYSVIAFFVALRTSEFGIRVALGARSADIVRMVLGQALRLAGIGLAVGAVLGTPLLIALHANFPFTERFDPAVILPAALAARPDRPFRGLGAGSQSVLDSGVGGPPGGLIPSTGAAAARAAAAETRAPARRADRRRALLDARQRLRVLVMEAAERALLHDARAAAAAGGGGHDGRLGRRLGPVAALRALRVSGHHFG